MTALWKQGFQLLSDGLQLFPSFQYSIVEVWVKASRVFKAVKVTLTKSAELFLLLNRTWFHCHHQFCLVFSYQQSLPVLSRKQRTILDPVDLASLQDFLSFFFDSAVSGVFQQWAPIAISYCSESSVSVQWQSPSGLNCIFTFRTMTSKLECGCCRLFFPDLVCDGRP